MKKESMFRSINYKTINRIYLSTCFLSLELEDELTSRWWNLPARLQHPFHRATAKTPKNAPNSPSTFDLLTKEEPKNDVARKILHADEGISKIERRKTALNTYPYARTTREECKARDKGPPPNDHMTPHHASHGGNLLTY